MPEASDYIIVMKDPAYTIENYAEVATCALKLGCPIN